MRIVGGRDYYDSALAFGHDPGVVYVRGEATLKRGVDEEESRYRMRDRGSKHEETAADLGFAIARFPGRIEEVEKRRKDRRYRRHSWWSIRDWNTRGEVSAGKHKFLFTFPTVVACGVRYDGVRVDKTVGTHPYPDRHTGTVYCWDLPALINLLAQYDLTYTTTREKIEQYFEPKELSRELRNTMIDHRWTVLVFDGIRNSYDSWLIDQPVLRQLEFYKLVPPATMFQEISMWVGGVLPAPGNPTVEVSNEVKIVKHGMDPKTAFRKPKE